MVLRKKMIRDMMENKLAYLSCILIISIGLMTSVAMGMISQDLIYAKDTFYEDYAFADAFATVTAMPKTDLKAIEGIEGIDMVEGRLVYDIRVYMPDDNESITLRMVSYDTSDGNLLNQPYLLEGSPIESSKKQIWLGVKFYEAHELSLGDTLPCIIGGNKVNFEVMGTVQTPEFVFPVQSETILMQEAKNFDIAFVPYDMMEKLLNKPGMVNDIAFTIKPGYDFDSLEDQIKNKLYPYGLIKLFDKEDQPSNLLLEEELNGLVEVSSSMPIIFLTISTVILYIMLRRLVEQQRGYIGVLKAFGYTKKEVMGHYITYALVIGIVGGLTGSALGIALAYPMMMLYEFFFNLPGLEVHFSLYHFIYSMVLALIFSLVAGYSGSRKILKLNPAEAMHRPAPKFHNKTVVERITVVWEALNVQGKMAVRNIFRNKGRSAFTLIGIIFSFSIMATMFSFVDMMDLMFINQYTKIEKYDMKLELAIPANVNDILSELEHTDGVQLAEPLVMIPSTLENRGMDEDYVIYGIPSDSQLYSVVDSKEKTVQIPSTGLMIPERVAEDFGLDLGDDIYVESPFLDEGKMLVVKAIVPQYLGANLYMDSEYLYDLLRTPEFASSIMLKVEDGYEDIIKDKFYDATNVLYVQEKEEILENFEEMVGPFLPMIYVYGGIAVLIAFAIIYTASIISLSERKREFASMRVLGMHPREVMNVLSTEQWILGVVGAVLGIPVTYWMLDAMSSVYQNDIFTLPTVLKPKVFMLAFIGILVAIFLVQRYVFKKIKALDIVEVLKERE
ncbi:ABC transporter permease [Vallitalea okinawensis]|uniref:ABC transporter permease n=1 Tax=Vallitalea okinawensis TaxID=2078660 RepID=UPI000CFE195B|nr:FtsX-like permease family protein [Vallitalea okinawensis]